MYVAKFGLRIIIIIMYVLVYLNFSQTEYNIYEDDGPLCIELTFNKPAHFDTTIEIINSTGNTTG